jgi:N-acetylneuraminic acid mutarotase
MRKHHLPPGAGTLCLPLILGFAVSVGAQSGSANQWAWMSGSNTNGNNGYVAGIYGTLGVPSLDNSPSGRTAAATWTDNRGHLWLFGGFLTQGSQLYTMNDLWEFAPETNEWTWQGGNSSPPCSIVQNNTQCAEPGVYGTKGVPAAGNFPGGRDFAASWTDANGKLWLYGGGGFDSIGQLGELNDLWRFDPDTRQWTWMNGDATLPGTGYGGPGVYGTMGTPAVGNNPGGLEFAMTWPDASGNGWIFGGWGFDVNGANGLPNNLWKFDSSLREWSWIEGTKQFGPPWIRPTVYGTVGTFAAGNVPGSRWKSAVWTAGDGHLWLFGGGGFDSPGNSGFLNELWQYDAATNQWAWMAGQNVMQCGPNRMNQNCGNAGVYGTRGQPAAGNLPGGRSGAVSWTGRDGHFWLMSGGGFNASGTFTTLDDFWEFDPSTKEWTWISGLKDSGPAITTYGALRVPAAGNYPGARYGAISWTDPGGNLWLFGGNAFDANGNLGLLNDLWKYQPASAIQVLGADFTVAASGTSLTIHAGRAERPP